MVCPPLDNCLVFFYYSTDESSFLCSKFLLVHISNFFLPNFEFYNLNLSLQNGDYQRYSSIKLAVFLFLFFLYHYFLVHKLDYLVGVLIRKLHLFMHFLIHGLDMRYPLPHPLYRRASSELNILLRIFISSFTWTRMPLALYI